MLVDLDYFFAQCEELRNPLIKDKPVVVGMYSGRTEDSGAVSTANYIARGYGVKSGIPLFLAKKRLEGVESVFLPVNYEYYETVSREIMQIFRSHADAFEQVGIDEAYLDVTQRANGDFDAAKEIAKRIKAEVSNSIRISFSAGIGPNKLIAKIACDVQKPDGLTVITPREVKNFLQPLPVDRLLGVGRKTAAKMEGLGVRTVGDLAKFDVQKLIAVFGRNLGIYFHNAANGVNDEPVQETGEAESISRIATLKENTRDLVIILDKSSQLAADLHRELAEKKLWFRHVGIVAILTNLTIRSRSKTLDSPSNDLETINRVVRELFERFLAESDLDVRRVGIKVASFVKVERSQRQLTKFFVSK